MNKRPVFRPFGRDAEVEICERNLPHWFQPGVAIFVTFRTADSLPMAVAIRLQRELEEWLLANNLPASLASLTREAGFNTSTHLTNIPAAKQREFKKLSDRLWHGALDECHGECVLRDPGCSRIVADAVVYFNHKRYDLDRFVVMPNHVHAIVQFRKGWDLNTVSQSWMRFTARKINALNGASGAFWQPEPFDHLIRSDVQFEYLQRYIAQNPEKANLRDGESYYWQRPV